MVKNLPAMQETQVQSLSPLEKGMSAAAAAAKLLQSCPTLCDPIDGGPPGPPIPGILQARTLEWVAISLSNAWKWKVKVKSFSRVRLVATPWTAAYQAPLSMGFSRQEYWSGVPLLLAPYSCLENSMDMSLESLGSQKSDMTEWLTHSKMFIHKTITFP